MFSCFDISNTDSTDNTDACSRWDAHIAFVERKRHE